jgi:hypothetical protein
MSEEELERAAGRPLAEAVRFRVAADLPGGGRSWSPVLGERTALEAESRTWEATRLALLAVAVVLAAGAVAMLLVGRRPRVRGRGPAT